MKTDIKITGGRLCYPMPEEVDHHVASEIASKVDALIEAYAIREVELDFSKTNFMDSSGIGVVIGRSRKMHFHGGRLVATGVGRRVGLIFQSAGLDRIITIERKEEDGSSKKSSRA